jgi:hypothetical protein
MPTSASVETVPRLAWKLSDEGDREDKVFHSMHPT